MYLHGTMSTGQPDVQRGVRPSKSGRLRSACDTCHQSKTKCSGGLPCVTCAMSHGQCTYSVGNRLGRPKGSKNKRILLQENHISNQAGAGDGDRVPRRQRQQLRQQRSMSPHSENSYDRASAEEMFVDEHSEHPLGPELSSLFNALGAEDLGNALMDTSTKGLDPTAFSQDHISLPLPLHKTFPFDDAVNASKANYCNGTLDVSSSIDPPNYEPPYTAPRIDTETDPRTHDYFPPEQPPCSCLQQHIQLVYYLEDLQYTHNTSLSISSVLDSVRQAQGPWTSLMHCLQCQNPKEQEVFLLFAMSIRILLYSAQNFYTCHQGGLHESPSPARQSSSSAASSVPVSVGGHELVGEEKNLVIGLTFQNALQRIGSALIYLWQRTDECRLLSGDEMETRSIQLLKCFSGNSLSANLGTDEIRLLLRNLQGTMQAMKDVLRRNNSKDSS